MEGFTQWLGLPFLKKIFDQERFDCELFYSNQNVTTVPHYIYHSLPDNIHIVLENDNTVLIKGT